MCVQTEKTEKAFSHHRNQDTRRQNHAQQQPLSPIANPRSITAKAPRSNSRLIDLSSVSFDATRETGHDKLLLRLPWRRVLATRHLAPDVAVIDEADRGRATVDHLRR